VSDKTLERYNLIMFPFDKSDIGPLNSRIIKEYVLPRLTPLSDVLVVGHTDVIGAENYNLPLSESRGLRAKEETARLAQTVVPNGVKSLDSKGVGEAEPLFPNTLPEGRLYNRTVQVIIETPFGE
jgi:outer membrane protein OmpA-like peptidoglycan-associated protein